jgi:TonB family protein
VISGVASIYAYDARLEDQSLEIVLMTPVEFLDLSTAQPPVDHSDGGSSVNNDQGIPEREFAMAPVHRADIVPEGISSTPNKNLPLPPGPVRITGEDRGTGFRGPGPGGIRPTGSNLSRTTIIEIETPPPPPEQKPKPLIISKGPVNGEALLLPKPAYPEMAKAIRLQGKVNIQVLIDEMGKVVSAKAVDGHPAFRKVSEEAAFKARFSPTRLGDQAVKVSGVITYNFVLQ